MQKNVIEERERVEWSNTWIAKANREEPRCLLIGDSVTRQIRSELERFLLNKMPIDLYAASYALTDSIFWTGLKTFLESGYSYEVIIIHYGFHHGFSKYCATDKQSYEEYKAYYTKLIELCKKYSNKIILMTGTSYVCRENLEIIDSDLEPEIIKRNQISRELASEYSIPVFDLYNLMKLQGKIYKYVDHVHFEAIAYVFIAYHISQFIFLKEIPALMDALRLSVAEDELAFIKDSEVAIYGCGIEGIRLYFQLKFFLPQISLRCWYKTKCEGQQLQFMYGIPIYEVKNVQNKDITVIISSSKYVDEMEKELINNGFGRYIKMVKQ